MFRPSRLLSILLPASLLVASAAKGEPIEVPSGMDWLVAAPKAAHFAGEAEAFLGTVGGHSTTLAPHRVNGELVRSVAFPLLSKDQLADAGVDVGRGWMLFEKGRAVYLSLFVRDAEKVVEYLEGWAKRRYFGHREEGTFADGKGSWVLFARGSGAKPLAGYALTGDRLVVLAGAGGSAAGLRSAMEAIQGASRENPGVEGALLMKFIHLHGARDLWIGLRGNSSGLSLEALARETDARLLKPMKADQQWAGALSSSGNAPVPAVFRLRAMAGPGAAGFLADLLSPLIPRAKSSDSGRWWKSVGALAEGPVELIFSDLALSDPGRAVFELLAPPVVILPGRGERQGAEWIQSAAKLAGKEPVGDSVDLPLGDRRVTVGRSGASLFAGDVEAKALDRIAAVPEGKGALSCPSGTAVASARLEPALAAEQLRRIGLLAALKDDRLMKFFGLNTEYGSLMRGSRPIVALACQEKAGVLRARAHWPLAPPPAR